MRRNSSRVLAAALQRWKLRVERLRDKERDALSIAARIDQRLLQSHITIWAQHFASRKRLERRSQRAYEVTLKAKALISWKHKMRAHTKTLKEAKLVHRLFLQRMAMQRWREMVEQRSRERRLQILFGKRMGDALRIWANKTKLRRTLRRKGDVVAMAVQTVGPFAVECDMD
jgi:protein SFI1